MIAKIRISEISASKIEFWSTFLETFFKYFSFVSTDFNSSQIGTRTWLYMLWTSMHVFIEPMQCDWDDWPISRPIQNDPANKKNKTSIFHILPKCITSSCIFWCYRLQWTGECTSFLMQTKIDSKMADSRWPQINIWHRSTSRSRSAAEGQPTCFKNIWNTVTPASERGIYDKYSIGDRRWILSSLYIAQA